VIQMKQWFMVVVWMLFGASSVAAAAQSGPVPVARLSTGVAKLGGAVTLQIEIEGARSASILEVPEVEGLSISQPGRPSRNEFRSVVNGRVTRRSSLRWTLEVRPREAGDFVIPPIPLEVDGRRTATRELPLRVVKDLRGEDLGFFEIVDAPQAVFEGQPFTVDLRMGWEATLSIERADLRLPWWGNQPGMLEVEGAARNVRSKWLNFGLNGGRGQVQVEELPQETRAGRRYRCFRLRRNFIPSRDGPLEFSVSVLEFASISQRGFLQNSYESYYALLPAFELNVKTIPEEGRPFDWTGAVGLIEAGRRVDRRDVDVGESIKLAVSWTGPGNLEFFDAPDPARLDSFAGFRVLGTEDEFRGDERRVTYDLVPTSPEVDEIPGLPLWIFDPLLEVYREIETEPVSIRVRPLAEGVGLGLEEEQARGDGVLIDIRDLHLTPAGDEDLTRPGAGRVVGAFFAIGLIWFVGRKYVRRRGDPDSIEARRRRAAARALRRGLKAASSARGQAEVFQGFLAARTGEAQQAWLGRDARRWSADADGAQLDPALASELGDLLAQLDQRTWAGDGRPLEISVLVSLSDRLMKGGL
jgi:hypothetical protein